MTGFWTGVRWALDFLLVSALVALVLIHLLKMQTSTVRDLHDPSYAPGATTVITSLHGYCVCNPHLAIRQP